MRFGTLPSDEIERRRNASIEALRERERERFARWYQERLDQFYWQHGPCCAGCDHWSSEAGDTGECMLAPPVSGHDVMRSCGIEWSSYRFPPGQPYTAHDHVCGLFKDEFDWTTLDEAYRKRIGAR